MKSYQIMVGFTVMVFSLITGNAYGQASKNYRTGNLTSYTFYVPLRWEVGGSAEEQQIREVLEEGLKMTDSRSKITALSTFSMPEGAIITVYELSMPVGEGANYIDTMFKLSIDKFRMGESGGLVKKVFENRKATLGSFNAVLMDWESTRGSFPHFRQWTLHHSGENIDKVVSIDTFSNSRGYKAGKEEIDRIASTLRVKSGK